jgi:proline iminopeptidase
VEGLWGVLLNPLPENRTRLVIGGYEAFRPHWLGPVSSFFGVATVWIMQARMLAVLKRIAERTSEHTGGSV